ncbi:MAG: aminopeptidase [Myxococcales bacterium]|nr:aminopeptidase [Myxococcales bacterium]
MKLGSCACAVACCTLLLLALPGCYLVKLAGGQLELINEQVPLAQALSAERDPERQKLLSLVPDLHSYASKVVQLRPGNNYRTYFATEKKGITHVLVACEKTSLEPYTWSFPIAGEVPYKSHFEEADARVEEAELIAAGYDTWVGHATAYSTLGFLRDPVTTVMTQRGLVAFVEVLFHEMAHGRFYVAGDSDFNEQLASFVGARAAEDYLRSRFGHDPAVMEELRTHLARQAPFREAVAGALAQLERLYGSGRAPAEVLRRRQPIFAALERRLSALYPELDPEELTMNNARLTQYRRYRGDAAYLEAMWQDSGGSWVAFWRRVELYARLM